MCLFCLAARKEGDLAACYFGESGKNMHCRCKEHISKFNSKSAKVQSKSSFVKHLVSKHGGRDRNRSLMNILNLKYWKLLQDVLRREP